MKKILVVFGTRPEAIKMAPVIKELEKKKDQIDTKICVTAQHREMLDQILGLFEIVPDFDLNIMHEGQDLTEITTRVLEGMKGVLKIVKPDLVLVHGDTTTSMAAGMAAFYFKIKVGHVEAGLRTYNMQAPWPEEMNRQLTDRLCDYCFAPTILAQKNLLEEKIEKNKILVTGNTVIDALFLAVRMLDTKPELVNMSRAILKENGYETGDRRYILVTGHRRESFGSGFLNICNALKEIAFLNPETDIVYPVHLNPNVKGPVFSLLKGIDNVYLLNPLDYLPFIHLMQHAHLILTDSGGIQEEAPSLGKPVLVMRDTTERPEAIEAGTALLVGTDPQKIISHVNELLNDDTSYKRMVIKRNPYGDGKASQRIVNLLMDN